MFKKTSIFKFNSFKWKLLKIESDMSVDTSDSVKKANMRDKIVWVTVT